jgi:hypothetical protein
MHQCDYCCWYNDRSENCDCPRIMKEKEFDDKLYNHEKCNENSQEISRT